MDIRGPQVQVPRRRLVAGKTRLLHLALHAGFVVFAWVAIAGLAVAVVILDADLPVNFVWMVALGYALWHAVCTSAVALLISRFSIAPGLIVALHLISPPITFAIYAALQIPVWQKVLR